MCIHLLRLVSVITCKKIMKNQQKKIFAFVRFFQYHTYVHTYVFEEMDEHICALFSYEMPELTGMLKCFLWGPVVVVAHALTSSQCIRYRCTDTDLICIMTPFLVRKIFAYAHVLNINLLLLLIYSVNALSFSSNSLFSLLPPLIARSILFYIKTYHQKLI